MLPRDREIALECGGDSACSDTLLGESDCVLTRQRPKLRPRPARRRRSTDVQAATNRHLGSEYLSEETTVSTEGAAGSPSPSIDSPQSQRVESIDALRGFDMFWILGGEHLVVSLHKAGEQQGFTGLSTFAQQMGHVAWEGFHFYDLIFPLFVFLMGVSTVFSLTKILESDGKKAAYWRVIRRFALLYFLGLFYHGALSRDGGPEMFRYVGVLHRIAISYLVGGVLFINLRFRGLLAAAAVLLVGYWAAMTFIPVPGGVAGSFAEGSNLANYIDAQYLPGYKWDGDWDPEGLLSSFPAVVSGILGMFAAFVLRRSDLSPQQRVGLLCVAGLACIALGYGWSLQFPIVKKLWTSSFVLVAGGWSYLLVALFYFLIDVKNFRLGFRPFVWIGMNCIAIYMIRNLVGGFGGLVRRVVHEPVVSEMGAWGDLVVTALGLLLAIGFCRYLYKNGMFVRV